MSEDKLELLIDQLKLCGCGCPEDAAKYIGKALALVQRIETHVWPKLIPYSDWEKEEKELFPVVGSNYFVYYNLSELELTEHGGSVPGWLTEKGKTLLAQIEELE